MLAGAQPFITVARWLGIACGAVVVSLSAVMIWFNPYATPLPDEIAHTQLIFGILSLLGVLGAVAAWLRAPSIVLVVFLISFLPVGLYLLSSMSIFSFLGVAHIGFLVSALILYTFKPNVVRQKAQHDA
jgi:hypothetical protein